MLTLSAPFTNGYRCSIGTRITFDVGSRISDGAMNDTHPSAEISPALDGMTNDPCTAIFEIVIESDSPQGVWCHSRWLQGQSHRTPLRCWPHTSQPGHPAGSGCRRGTRIRALSPRHDSTADRSPSDPTCRSVQ